MRPIPKDKLERLVQASCSMMGEQGQPIHIGDPGQCPRVCIVLTAAPGLWPEKTGAYCVSGSVACPPTVVLTVLGLQKPLGLKVLTLAE